ncbi:MAG: hypothetical protein U0641_16160 [Anaerolineae bacterium]
MTFPKPWLLAGLGVASVAVYIRWLALPMALPRYVDQPLLDLQKILGETPTATVFFLAVLLVLFGLYYLGYTLVLTMSGRSLPWLVLLPPAVSSAALIFMYPVTAADIFQYVWLGRIWAFLGLNPFITTPNMRPDELLYPYTIFRNFPTVYGAGFIQLAGLLARLGGDDILLNVIIFKLAMVASYALCVALVYLILRRTRPALAWAGVYVLAWNPLVVFNTAGDGHNDIMMILLALLAIYLAQRGMWTAAATILVLSASVKWLSLALAPVFLIVAIRMLGRRGLVKVGGGLAIGLGLAALIQAPFYAGPASLVGGIPNIGSQFTASLATVARDILTAPLGADGAAQMARLAAFGLFAVLYVWQLLRLEGAFESLVYGAYQVFFFYLVIAAVWFQPWYVVWLVPLAALLVGEPVVERTVIFSFTAMLVHIFLGFGWRLAWFGGSVPTLQMVTTLLIVLPPVLWWITAEARRPLPMMNAQ